ncbi:MAG TPA: MFS transporter [Euzebyales bacterium]|nr:MFS transporter [Euzebyales bacterium]
MPEPDPPAASTPPAATVRDVFAPERRAAATAILLTVALAAFEGLAVSAALPQVAADLGSVDLLPWVITAFGLTSGVATVATGALIDGIGASRVFRVAVALFTIGGVAAGLAGSMPWMIAARLVHGAGAGATIAVGLAAVGLVFPRELVGRAFALNSTVWGVMGVAAPALAAAMLTVGSWRWIFLVNLPLGLVALLAGWRALPDHGTAQRTPPDVVGLGLVAVFTALLLIGVDALGPGSLAAGIVAVAVGWVYVRRARGRDAAVIRPRHVLDAPFGPLAWSISLLLTGAIAVASFVPLYVQGGRGAGTALTAWSVLFFTVGWTTGANAGSKLLDRVAESTVVAGSFAVAAPAAFVVAALAAVDAPLWMVFVALTVQGIGVGAATNAALTLLRAVAGDDELGRATAAHQFLRNQGITVGAALGGATILVVVARRIGDIERVRDLLAGTTDVTSAAVADAIAVGFATAALAGAAVIVAGAVPLVALRRSLAAARRRRRG